MVYLKKWAEFSAKSIDLCKKSPEKTRYLIKATPSQQWLILKVTDDNECLKFRSRSQVILNRFDTLTRDLTAIMAGQSLPSEAAAAATAAAKATLATDAMDIDGQLDSNKSKASASTTATTTTTGGGASKKKKKKGKK